MFYFTNKTMSYKMCSKQSLIDSIINTILEKEPSLVHTLRERLNDPKTFASSALRNTIFVGADESFIMDILEFIRLDEPENFETHLNEAIQSLVAYNKLDILLKIISIYPQADLHFDNELPLQIACQNGNAEIVQFLMECGANPNIGNMNAIEAARDQQHILQLLNKKY